MFKKVLVALATLTLLCGCQNSSIPGTYQGEAFETNQRVGGSKDLGVPSSEPGQPKVGVMATVTPPPAMSLSVGSLKVQLQPQSSTHAQVAKDQFFEVDSKDFKGKVLITGEVYTYGEGFLMVQLTGIPADKDQPIRYAFNFRGARK